MQPIYPITDKTCRSLYGKPVLIFLNDGSEIYGVLSRIEKNKLILNEKKQKNHFQIKNN
jgi:small nuclear ribonucleoprotein (snRNP)-like protein